MPPAKSRACRKRIPTRPCWRNYRPSGKRGEWRMKVMVTGGCGFIGSAVCRHLVGDLGHQRRQCRQDDLCSERRFDRRDRAQPELPPPQARHMRPRRDAEIDARRGGGRGHAPGRRKPCRPLDRCAIGLHRDQHRRHLRAAAGRARLAPGNAARAAGRLSAFTMYRPTRSMATCRWTAASSPRKRPMRRLRLMPRPRRPPTIWRWLGTTPMACRWLCRTARTIMGPTTSRKSSFR